MSDEPAKDEPERSKAEKPSPRDSSAVAGEPRAWAAAAAVTLLTGAAVTYAFSPQAAGPSRMLPVVGAAYLVLAIPACLYLHRRGELRESLLPRRLDVTAGAFVAVVMYMLASLVQVAIRGGPLDGWIFRLYLQLGDPREVAAIWVGPAIMVIAALEEVVWRGWVMHALGRTHGHRRALWIAAGLYALAHAGTVVVLADPTSGPNPMLLLAAAGGGLVWGLLAQRFDRLGPSIFAHAFFSWAMALFPLWRL